MSERKKPAVPPVGKARALSDFFSSQAMLCLITLMVFIGLVIALAPVGLSYLKQSASTSGGVGANTGATRGAGIRAAVPCNPVLVTFTDEVPLGKLNRLLNSLDASIAFGPNENGAFELALPVAGVAAAVEALNRMPEVVVVASLRVQCLPAGQ